MQVKITELSGQGIDTRRSEFEKILFYLPTASQITYSYITLAVGSIFTIELGGQGCDVKAN